MSKSTAVFAALMLGSALNLAAGRAYGTCGTLNQACSIFAPCCSGKNRQMKAMVLAAGLGTNHTTIVLNRLGMPGGLKLPLIEQGLGAKPTVQIPELAKQLARAANLGKPALAECPAFTKAMAMLAQEVSGAPANRMSHAGNRSLFSRMFGR